MPQHEKPVISDTSGIKTWLDSLQQESWQLELLISGFTIFLLIGGWAPLVDLEYDLALRRWSSEFYGMFNFLYYVMRTAYLSLLFCLLFHVVLRGVWIAAIGLRSVSGDIDYDQFTYQSRFVNRLRRRLGTFDDYIGRMERNCSVIFSLAFLIFFCFLSLATWSLMAIFVQYIYLLFWGGTWQGNGILGGAGIVTMAVFSAGIVYLFDFVTLGLLKRVKWISRPYYYLYVVMGWVTLARFYRPLYYNLIDNQFGKRLAMALPLIIFGILIIISLKQVNYAYFPATVNDGQVWLDNNNYDDERPDRFEQIWRMSLNSRYAENNFIEAFIPYRPIQDDALLNKLKPGLRVSQFIGIKLRGAFSEGKIINDAADYPEILGVFSQLYKIHLNDSLMTELQPLFHYHPEREQPGLQYMIPVHNLPNGKHRLLLQALVPDADTLRWSAGRTIYFYK